MEDVHVATQCSITIGTAQKILKEDLLVSKMSYRRVPRTLTDVERFKAGRSEKKSC